MVISASTLIQARTADQSNANDLQEQWFYRMLQKTYPLHIAAHAAMMYAWGGLPFLVWGVAVRTVWVYHVTWFVNSASHVWGNKAYKTPTNDTSRNNWWVGILAFGMLCHGLLSVHFVPMPADYDFFHICCSLSAGAHKPPSQRTPPAINPPPIHGDT